MGVEVARRSLGRFVWWFVDVISALLDRDEREAVRGDIAESGASGGSALWDVSGLVVRRHGELWLNWRPWFTLMGIVVPVGVLLSNVSRHWGQGAAIYFSVYAGDEVSTSLAGSVWATGGQLELTRLLTWFFLNALTLVGWSYAAGWTLGSLSRRTIWTTGLLFYLVLVSGTVGWASVGSPVNIEISSLGYGVPAIHRAVFVVAPALWGMYQGAQSVALSRHRAILAAVAVAFLTHRAAVDLQVSLISWSSRPPTRQDWLRLLMVLAVSWPVGYIVANVWSRRSLAGGY